MTRSRKVWLAGGAVILILASIVACLAMWISNTPDIAPLADFAPNSRHQISAGACLTGSVTAISYAEIPVSLRQAISAEAHAAIIPLQISRSLFCNSHDGLLQRELKELFVAKELELRFSSEQLLTIYLNRVYFGEATVGVQNAAQHYFSKDAATLNLSQAALLAGIARNPRFYSPDQHPDRALQRRNQILDAMSHQDNINSAEMRAAKAQPVR